MADIHRRRVVHGLAWTAPVIAATTAAPAYAVSPGNCTPSVGGSGSVFYDWGTITTTPTTTATTTQSLTMFGSVSATTLPADAVITAIWFE